MSHQGCVQCHNLAIIFTGSAQNIHKTFSLIVDIRRVRCFFRAIWWFSWYLERIYVALVLKMVSLEGVWAI